MMRHRVLDTVPLEMKRQERVCQWKEERFCDVSIGRGERK